ncbi:MAG TPA: MBL fold metallo-hydrolase [Gammaproteobacteria bacterium]|nr:MBL fold metallo-hydrolase [Gammaproteobacteria bacterium]
MNTRPRSLLATAGLALVLTAATSAQTLDIYFVDVEGGQATLIVTPAKETFLIDTGYAGSGRGPAQAGDPREARDAGMTQIDYLMITHFHGDHDGGIVELSQLLPIKTFVDHGDVLPAAEQNVPGTKEYFNAYAAVRATGNHLEPKPGDRLPLKGVDVTVVSSAAVILSKALNDAGGRNAACGPSGLPAGDPNENPRSTGVLLQFGKFRFLDVGDLSGPPLFQLACPNDMIGPVDVYLVAHHGGSDAAEPATFAAFRPRVSILNNGATKGGAADMFTFLHQTEDRGDVWQLHRSNAAGSNNFAEERIANLAETTAHWIKITANDDGSFKVMNARTGAWQDYSAQ